MIYIVFVRLSIDLGEVCDLPIEYRCEGCYCYSGLLLRHTAALNRISEFYKRPSSSAHV